MIPILITCTHLATSGDSDILINRMTKEAVPLAEGTPVGILLEEPVSSDFSLTLYRNSQTRELVIGFYDSVTNAEEITRVILEKSDQYSIPPALAFALCGIESGYNSRAVGHNTVSVDRGLFQLNSMSFPELSEEEFFSLEKNADYGLKYLRYCLDRGENEVVALALYNAGEGQVSSIGAPMHTLNYINKILSFRDELETKFRDSILDKFTS